jgi:hypothetical protein
VLLADDGAHRLRPGAIPPGDIESVKSAAMGLEEGTAMSKSSGKKLSKKSKDAVSGRDRRAGRLEEALAAGLKREAKVASRLEAAQLEVAVLRMALAEVVGEVLVEAAPGAGAEVEAEPTLKAAAAVKAARAPKAPRVAKPASAKPAPAAKAPAPKAPRAAKTPATAKPAARPRAAKPAPAPKPPTTRPRRTPRNGPADS